MKKVILWTLLFLSLGLVFSGCERNDYQHPLHRSKNK